MAHNKEEFPTLGGSPKKSAGSPKTKGNFKKNPGKKGFKKIEGLALEPPREAPPDFKNRVPAPKKESSSPPSVSDALPDWLQKPADRAEPGPVWQERPKGSHAEEMATLRKLHATEQKINAEVERLNPKEKKEHVESQRDKEKAEKAAKVAAAAAPEPSKKEKKASPKAAPASPKKAGEPSEADWNALAAKQQAVLKKLEAAEQALGGGDVVAAALTKPEKYVFQPGHFHYAGCPNDTEADHAKTNCACKDKVAAHNSLLEERAKQTVGRKRPAAAKPPSSSELIESVKQWSPPVEASLDAAIAHLLPKNSRSLKLLGGAAAAPAAGGENWDALESKQQAVLSKIGSVERALAGGKDDWGGLEARQKNQLAQLARLEAALSGGASAAGSGGASSAAGGAGWDALAAQQQRVLASADSLDSQMWAWLAQRQQGILADARSLEDIGAALGPGENWGALKAKQEAVLAKADALDAKLGGQPASKKAASPKAAAVAAPKAAAPAAGEGAAILAAAAAAGDKVRDLKAAKGDKAAVKAAVDELLALKAKYTEVTGQPFPAAGAPAPSSEGSKNKPPPAGAESSKKGSEGGSPKAAPASAKAAAAPASPKAKPVSAAGVGTVVGPVSSGALPKGVAFNAFNPKYYESDAIRHLVKAALPLLQAQVKGAEEARPAILQWAIGSPTLTHVVLRFEGLNGQDKDFYAQLQRVPQIDHGKVEVLSLADLSGSGSAAAQPGASQPLFHMNAAVLASIPNAFKDMPLTSAGERVQLDESGDSLFVYDGMLLDDLLAPHEYLALRYKDGKGVNAGKTERGFFRVLNGKTVYVMGPGSQEHPAGHAVTVSLFTQGENSISVERGAPQVGVSAVTPASGHLPRGTTARFEAHIKDGTADDASKRAEGETALCGGHSCGARVVFDLASPSAPQWCMSCMAYKCRACAASCFYFDHVLQRYTGRGRDVLGATATLAPGTCAGIAAAKIKEEWEMSFNERGTNSLCFALPHPRVTHSKSVVLGLPSASGNSIIFVYAGTWDLTKVMVEPEYTGPAGKDFDEKAKAFKDDFAAKFDKLASDAKSFLLVHPVFFPLTADLLDGAKAAVQAAVDALTLVEQDAASKELGLTHLPKRF